MANGTMSEPTENSQNEDRTEDQKLLQAEQPDELGVAAVETLIEHQDKEQSEKEFRRKIYALFEIEREWARCQTVDEICLNAVVNGREKLGFERLSIWFLNSNAYTMQGTFGVDEHGQIRDERAQQFHGNPRIFTLPFTETHALVITQENRPLLNDQGIEIGIGTNLIAALWDGEEILGHLYCDNLLTGQPFTDLQKELLAHFASKIANAVARKRSEQSLRQSEEQFRLLSQAAPMGIFLQTANGQCLYVNPRWQEITQINQEQALGSGWFQMIHPDDKKRVFEEWDHYAQNPQGEFRADFLILRPSGEARWVCGRARAIMDVHQTPLYYVGTLEDLTERMAMQAELLQAQKLESIGRLAGGIAHDFNNLLTAILGYTDLAVAQTQPESPVAQSLKQIAQAANSAVDLTKQLLTFARRQPITPKLIDIHQLIKETETILKPLLGSQVDLRIRLAKSLWKVKMDPVQFQQILMNLSVNARDAMPNGGTLTINAANLRLEKGPHPPGDYVLITVQDTGVGIDDHTKAHIFEPFFTTKEPERGTGLGLAISHGIITQNGGYIQAQSAQGQGATFEIYLPRAIEEEISAPPAHSK